MFKRVSIHGRTALICEPPCSRQGLPSPHVTMRRCELLPHSFHPYSLCRFYPLKKRYRFCGTFPRVASGRR